MASLIGPRRFQRPHKPRGKSPIDATAGGYGGTAPVVAGRRQPQETVPPPEFGHPVDLRTLPGPMQDRAEVLTAWVMGGAARRRMVAVLAGTGRPADEWINLVELSGAWVEALFLWMAFNPAARRIPCLPGCRGVDGDGCPNPRRFGSHLCPDCEAEVDSRGAVWAPRTEADARAAGLSVVRR